MANRKNLKKDVNYIVGELVSECITYKYFHAEVKDEQFNQAVAQLLDLRNDVIARINHVNGKEDRKLVKKHFQSIRADFNKSLEILDKLATK